MMENEYNPAWVKLFREKKNIEKTQPNKEIITTDVKLSSRDNSNSLL